MRAADHSFTRGVLLLQLIVVWLNADYLSEVALRCKLQGSFCASNGHCNPLPLPPHYLHLNSSLLAQVFGKVNVECASYSVLKTVGEGIELRRYSPCVAVETQCSRMDGRDGAFGRLAQYIG
jgi:hypothetical protein